MQTDTAQPQELPPFALSAEAAALVTAIAPAAVAAVIAEFPDAEHVGICPTWPDIQPHQGRRVPKDAAERAQYLAQRIESQQAELQGNISSYNRLREAGLAALSGYDICISSGGNPLAALRTALQLKKNHISYDLSILVRLTLELEDTQTELANATPPQQALF